MAIIVGMRVIGLKNFWKYVFIKTLYHDKGYIFEFLCKA